MSQANVQFTISIQLVFVQTLIINYSLVLLFRGGEDKNVFRATLDKRVEGQGQGYVLIRNSLIKNI